MTDFDDTAELDVILPGDVFRRQVLAWDAGFCLLVGLTLVAGWMTDRTVEFAEPWMTAAGGAAVVIWGLILAYAAQGTGGRGITTLVGLTNLIAAGLLIRIVLDRASDNIFAWLPIVLVLGFSAVQFVSAARR